MVLTACATPKLEAPPIAGTSIVPPIQYPNKNVPIRAGRASIFWGNHDSVHGTDVGILGNIVNKDFVGTSISGLFQSTNGTATILGLQLSGITNINRGKTHAAGVQAAGLFNISKGENNIYGVQLAALGNLGKKNKIYGFQLGIYNRAEVVYGFQLGVLNITDRLYGLQIGALNISHKNGLLFFPVINAGF